MGNLGGTLGDREGWHRGVPNSAVFTRDMARYLQPHARYLVEGGHLRAGITPEKARDVLRAYSSSELYELLVLRQGWTLEGWAQFIAEGMIAALLPAKGPRPVRSSRRRAAGST